MEEIPYQWVMYHIIIRLVYPETLTYKKLWVFFKLLWVFFLSALLKEIVAAHKPIGIHVYDGIFTYMNEGVDFFWEASWREIYGLTPSPWHPFILIGIPKDFFLRIGKSSECWTRLLGINACEQMAAGQSFFGLGVFSSNKNFLRKPKPWNVYNEKCSK